MSKSRGFAPQGWDWPKIPLKWKQHFIEHPGVVLSEGMESRTGGPKTPPAQPTYRLCYCEFVGQNGSVSAEVAGR